MTDYLVFRLYGPMAAWGDIAVGEYRPSFSHPSKSAVIGLFAAALGVRRDEEERQKDLADSCSYAVRVDAMGSLLRDYHTVQVPSTGPGRNRKIYRTRRAEMAETGLNTILSSRDYRCDAAYTVAISFSSGAPYSAQQVASALNRPVFVLYLGRKSCPLALPLSPKVVHAETVKGALAEAIAADELSILMQTESYVVYWESEDGGYERDQVITRRDMPRSRARWQFTERKENLATVSRKEGEPCTSP